MTSKTHIALGTVAVSASTLLLQTTGLVDLTIPQLAVTIGYGVVASVVPDIDSDRSKPRQVVNAIIAVTVIAVLALTFLKRFYDVNMYRYASGGVAESLVRWIPTIMFVALILLGTQSDHRHMTHSIVYGLALTMLIYMITRKATVTVGFGIAILSHDIVDLFNKKKVHLLWPMDGGFCFDLFTADGIIAKFINWLAVTISPVLIAANIWLIVKG